jgi:hypothetical protein
MPRHCSWFDTLVPVLFALLLALLYLVEKSNATFVSELFCRVDHCPSPRPERSICRTGELFPSPIFICMPSLLAIYSLFVLCLTDNDTMIFLAAVHADSEFTAIDIFDLDPLTSSTIAVFTLAVSFLP